MNSIAKEARATGTKADIDIKAGIKSDCGPPALYYCSSIENDWARGHVRYDGVKVHWFVSERPAGYTERYRGLFDSSDFYSVGQIEESFTADEARQFADYAKQLGSIIEIRPVDLPIAPRSIMPYGAIDVGGSSDFYMLSQVEGYPLPFSVWGYYDVEGCAVRSRSTPQEDILHAGPGVLVRFQETDDHELLVSIHPVH